MISDAPCWSFRRAGLGHLVEPASRLSWRTPPVRRRWDPGPGQVLPDLGTLERALEYLNLL